MLTNLYHGASHGPANYMQQLYHGAHHDCLLQSLYHGASHDHCLQQLYSYNENDMKDAE